MGKYIFLEGLKEEKNIQAGFRKDFVIAGDENSVILKITARTVYRVVLNGEIIHNGPARAAHKHSILDTVQLSRKVIVGENRLAIEVSGYNKASQCSTGESSFLYAELLIDEKIVLETDSSWSGVILTQKRQAVEQFSHARFFNELYDLDEIYLNWTTMPVGQIPCYAVEELDEDITLSDRIVPYPTFEKHQDYRILSLSDINYDENISVPNYFYENDENTRSLFERPAVEYMKSILTAFSGKFLIEDKEITISDRDNYAIDIDFPAISCSFIGIEFTCQNNCIIDLLHTDKITQSGKLKSRSDDGCNSVIRLHCKAGTTRFESFEPYIFKHLSIIARNCTGLKIHKIYAKEYQYSDTNKGSFLCDDVEINRIYNAARLTFRVSTLDVFMDCPGRERGGWLCDSLWTGRAEKLMFGDVAVNKAMLESFVHLFDFSKDRFGFPGCYPAGTDINIPNWSMFMLLQLFEYYTFSNDSVLIEKYYPLVEFLVSEFEKYENEHGLLENLPGWVFVDWSCSNNVEYLQPISVPTNALYAKMLEVVSSLYDREDLLIKATNIRDTIRNVSISNTPLALGDFFSDSLDKNEHGGLIPKTFFSESGQYYCHWLDVGGKERYPEMFETLVKEYGVCPECYPANIYVAKANAFIGTYIRFEMLSKYSEFAKLINEMKYLFSYMIGNGPGTLWEALSSAGSICHGFASHAGVWLMRDFLGIGIVNEVKNELTIAPHPCGLKWAKGTSHTNNGLVSLSWFIDKKNFELNLSLPKCYSVKLELPEELRGWNNVVLNGNKIDVDDMCIRNLCGEVTLLVSCKK